MKYLLVIVLILIVFVIACTPKAIPSASISGGIPSIANISTSQADIDSGNVVFTTKCVDCHSSKLKYLNNHTYDEATDVLNTMSRKAKLTQIEINHLAAYVNTVAKK